MKPVSPWQHSSGAKGLSVASCHDLQKSQPGLVDRAGGAIFILQVESWQAERQNDWPKVKQASKWDKSQDPVPPGHIFWSSVFHQPFPPKHPCLHLAPTVPCNYLHHKVSVLNLSVRQTLPYASWFYFQLMAQHLLHKRPSLNICWAKLYQTWDSDFNIKFISD